MASPREAIVIPDVIESWRYVWRAAAELLSVQGLRALRMALLVDDSRLLRGGTTTPPAMACSPVFPCEAACALAYCGWKGGELQSAAEVQGYFEVLCGRLGEELGDPNASSSFTQWYDEAPWPVVRTQLLAEVERALRKRGVGASA